MRNVIFHHIALMASAGAKTKLGTIALLENDQQSASVLYIEAGISLVNAICPFRIVADERERGEV